MRAVIVGLMGGPVSVDQPPLGGSGGRLMVTVRRQNIWRRSRRKLAECGPRLGGVMLGGELAVLQAPIFDGLSLDPFTLFDDGRSPAEVSVGRCHVGQALVVSLVVVMLDEGLDLGLEVAGQEVVFEQDAVLQGLVPALDLALGLRMARSATHMAHLVGLDIFGQFAGDVARSVVAEQPRLVQHRGAVTAVVLNFGPVSRAVELGSGVASGGSSEVVVSGRICFAGRPPTMR